MKLILILSFFSICGQVFSQSVGIGTPNPSPGAILDLTSSNQGLLPPRLTTVQRNAIASPVAGLMIFNTTTNTHEYYDGTQWMRTDPASTIPSNGATSMRHSNGGNSIVVYSDYQAIGFCLNPNFNTAAFWNGNVTFQQPIRGAIGANNAIVVYSAAEAKGYFLNGSTAGQWSSSNVQFSDSIRGAIAASNSIVVYSDHEAKGYYVPTSSPGTPGQWSAFSGPTFGTLGEIIRGAVASVNSIVLYSDHYAIAYSLHPSLASAAGSWSSFAFFSGTIRSAIATNNTILVYSDSQANGYYFNPSSPNIVGQWSPIPINIGIIKNAAGSN